MDILEKGHNIFVIFIVLINCDGLNSIPSHPNLRGPPGSPGINPNFRPILRQAEGCNQQSIAGGVALGFGLQVVISSGGRVRFHICGVTTGGLASQLGITEGNELLLIDDKAVVDQNIETVSEIFRTIQQEQEFNLIFRSQENSGRSTFKSSPSWRYITTVVSVKTTQRKKPIGDKTGDEIGPPGQREFTLQTTVSQQQTRVISEQGRVPEKPGCVNCGPPALPGPSICGPPGQPGTSDCVHPGIPGPSFQNTVRVLPLSKRCVRLYPRVLQHHCAARSAGLSGTSVPLQSPCHFLNSTLDELKFIDLDLLLQGNAVNYAAISHPMSSNTAAGRRRRRSNHDGSFFSVASLGNDVTYKVNVVNAGGFPISSTISKDILFKPHYGSTGSNQRSALESIKTHSYVCPKTVNGKEILSTCPAIYNLPVTLQDDLVVDMWNCASRSGQIRPDPVAPIGPAPDIREQANPERHHGIPETRRPGIPLERFHRIRAPSRGIP